MNLRTGPADLYPRITTLNTHTVTMPKNRWTFLQPSLSSCTLGIRQVNVQPFVFLNNSQGFLKTYRQRSAILFVAQSEYWLLCDISFRWLQIIRSLIGGGGEGRGGGLCSVYLLFPFYFNCFTFSFFSLSFSSTWPLTLPVIQFFLLARYTYCF